MTMLERAAIALEATDVDWSSDGRNGPIAAASLRRQVVRAVLVEIREADEAMVVACAGALQAHIDAMPAEIKNRYRNFKHGLKVPPRLKAAARFRAMIDAILKGEPT